MSQNTSKEILYLEAFSEKGSAEIRVNDIPILVINSEENMGYRARLIEYDVIQGVNTLEIIPDSTNSIISSRIAFYQENEWVDGKGGRTFIHTTSKNGERNIVKGNLKNKGVKLQWIDNDILYSSDTIEGKEISRNILQLLKNRDLEKLVPLLNTKGVSTEEKERLNISHSPSRQDRLKLTIDGIKQDNRWNFYDIDKTEIQLKLVGNRRLFQVCLPDGSPYFRTKGKTRFEWFSVGSMIGRKNGEWKIYK